MKKLLVVSAIAALGLTSVAFAGGLPEEMVAAPTAASSDASGIYVGFNGGWGFTNYKNNSFVTDLYFPGKFRKDNGFVGRVNIGYDFNQYFAAEAGYSYFSNKPNVGNFSGGNISTQAFDLYGKVKFPFVDGVRLFAKLGAGWLLMSSTIPIYQSYNHNANNINVAFGAGVEYSITKNIIAGLEWSRITGFSGASNVGRNYIPNADAFMIGLRYLIFSF